MKIKAVMNPRCFGKCSPVYANLISSLISGKIIRLPNSGLKIKVFMIYSLMFDLCASGRYMDVWCCVKITRVERGPSGKMQRTKNFRALKAPSPKQAQGSMWKRRKKGSKSQRWWMTARKYCFPAR